MDTQAITLTAASYIERDVSYRTNLHTSPFWQLYYVLQGNVAVLLDGEDLVLGADQLLVLPPEAERRHRTHSRAPTYLLMQFHNHRLPLDGLGGQAWSVPPQQRGAVEALIDECREPDRPAGLDMRVALTVNILMGLQRLRTRPERPPINRERQNLAMQQLTSWLNAHLARPVSRAAAARALDCSESSVARLVRREAGVSFGAFLTRLRLERAKDLLLNSATPIGTIGESVGWSSFSHFAHIFKRETGVTPSDYRRHGRRWHAGGA